MFIVSATNPLKHVTIEDSKSGKILDLVKIKKRKKMSSDEFFQILKLCSKLKKCHRYKKNYFGEKKISVFNNWRKFEINGIFLVTKFTLLLNQSFIFV